MSNGRGDDGSQDWFDNIQKQRMHQRHTQGNQQGNSKSYLDRKVGQQHNQTNLQQQPLTEINDPYIKRIVDGYKTQPHYGPAHTGGQVVERNSTSNYEVEVDMASMQQQIIRKQMEFQQQSGGQGFTVEEELMKLPPHLRQQFMPLTQGQMPAQQVQQNQQPQTIAIKEGYPVYRSLQQSFGNTMIMVKEAGVIDSQLARQSFAMKGMKDVYVIQPNQRTVNIQEIQNNPRLMTKLVEIQAPPMLSLGPLFVNQEAIVNNGQYNGGRQLLVDGNNQQQQFQRDNTRVNQQPQNPFQNGSRTILKG